jgi:hypothetical protein
MRLIAAAALVLATAMTLRAQVQPNVAPHPAPPQPLPFSHRTHAGAGAQCLTCHAGPGDGARMTFPAAATCMTCHRSIAATRPAIVKLAELARANQPIPWVRVYEVLPGVTWSHRPHVQAGVSCQACHGDVGALDAMAETTAVTGMASCVSCHEARGAPTACVTCHAWPGGR